ncbi:MAG: histidinol-phosphate transaminase [Chloroflexi bacterium]|nr:histidinol-phosphate transaminase [Chloroflexota bacterium]
MKPPRQAAALRDIRSLMRPHLVTAEPYEGVEPPEVLAQQAGIPEERLVKLNGNENPYGPSPKVAAALGRYRRYHLYPDPQQRHLRQMLAEYAGTSPDRVVAGAGSDELIDLLLRLFVGPGEGVIDCPPTFAMYATFIHLLGARLVLAPRDEAFGLDLRGIEEGARRGAKLVFVASPNNPTGNTTSEGTVRRLLELGLVVVVDEAYFEFTNQTVAPLVPHHANLVVLRTFSKWAGLAGLRLGYGIMDPTVAERLLAIKAPYNVNLAAEVAVEASLEDRDLLMSRVKAIVQARDQLREELARIPGVATFPSTANFLLCRMPHGKGRWVYQELARRGIFVRDFNTPLLQDCFRTSVGLPEENQALVKGLESIFEQGG